MRNLIDIEKLITPQKPWLHLMKCSEKDLYFFIKEIKISTELYVKIINGSKCRTKESFFEEIATAFKFPDYFGKNWDALDECLSDLEWLNERGYTLFFSNANEILIQEEKKQLLIFFNILERTIQYWSNINEQIGAHIQEQLDEQVTPSQKSFHIVFQCEPKMIDLFCSRLKRSKIESLNCF